MPSSFVDDPRAGGRLLHGQRLSGERARHERQHHAVGVGVEEHVLHELLGAEVLDLRHARAGGSRKAEEALAALRGVLEPLPAGVHEVALHVEDELAAAELGPRQRRVLRGVVREHEGAADDCRRPRTQRSSRAAPSPCRRPTPGTRAGRCRDRARGAWPRASPFRWRAGASSASGIGANSPLVAVSSLTGRRRPSGSLRKMRRIRRMGPPHGK